MAEMSNFLENALLNGTLNATTFTAPAAVYVALYTSDPTDTGTAGTEVSGGSYARTAVTFATASGTSGSVASNADCTFPQATGSWGTVGWIGIMNASTAGNLLYHTALDVSKTIDSGDIFKIASGSLTVTLA
jgi:hypothetical protein